MLLVATAASTQSCKKKNKGSSDGNLDFSQDTVVFDTVFTTIGSTTQHFTVRNPDNKTITIQEIELMGGANSPFSINFDGIQGTSFSDIEIEGGDSLYCFVEVTLNVNGGTLPMIVEDSIRFRTNGEDQFVKLAVWGQDAYFHYNDQNSGTWPNDKPHVIYGVARVENGATLTIPAGTDVYVHKLSALYVNRSTLNIEGTATDKVTFQGDRLEQDYDNVAGQFYGIYLDSVNPSTIDHLELKNGISGIHIESKNTGFAGQATLTIRNSEIWNNASYGILLYDEPKVVAENVLIHSNGIHAMIVLQGADMLFTHCNLLGYGGGDGSYPAVGVRNYFTTGGITTVTDLTMDFRNSIISGTAEEQLVFDTIPNGGVTIDINFRNCLVRIPSATQSNPMFNNCQFGNPGFVDADNDDFTFNPWSQMSDNANPAYTTGPPNEDLLGVPRNTGSPNPDIGVYEKL